MIKSANTEVRSYTWDEMDRLCHQLSDQIIASSFLPEIIIGIIRGGCFPSLLLAHRFQTRELYTINLTTTVDDSIRANKRVPTIHSVSGLPNLHSKCVLLVDDVTNSGATLTTAERAIEDLRPGTLKIACPVWDTVSDTEKIQKICKADFFVDKIHAWAKFPWENS